MKLYASESEHTHATGEYLVEIDEVLRSKERALHDYLDAQADINSKMREILVDWMAEVAGAYRMRFDTLFLAVNLVDRFLSCVQTSRQKLQLVGVVALFVAAKFEEVTPPFADRLAYSTDQAYTVDDIFEFENKLLSALSFKILVPTSAHFLERLQRINQCDKEHLKLTQYILELSLLSIGMVRYEPSRLCAAALLLSNELRGRLLVWPVAMQTASRYSQAALQDCSRELHQLLQKPPPDLQAIHKKYKSSPSVFRTSA